jgi:RNase P/RNase MRP subunit p29
MLNERIFHFVFADGKIIELDGKPAASRLYDRMERNEIDPLIHSELSKATHLDVVEMPLKDCVLYFSEMHQIPFVIDRDLLTAGQPRADMPITDYFAGIDLASALTLMTAPRGLGCDYRYGSIWITTAGDANEWTDPTGISELEPPTASQLAKALKEPFAFDVVEMPLADVVDYFAQKLAIRFDVSQLKGSERETMPITCTLRGVAFRDVLGRVLDDAGLRVRLDGETLVILPSEKETK